MSKLSDYLKAQKQFNTDEIAAIDRVVASQAGLATDVQALNDKITALQNSAGEVNAEDGALIDELERDGAALVGRTTAVAEALEVLDSLTAPTPPANS